MKILVGTKETQGQRENDFSWTVDGEMVTISSFCCDGEEIDGPCGCQRSFTGLGGRKATTTAKIIEREMTEDEFIETYRVSDERSGFKWTAEDEGAVRWLLEVISSFEVGDVLEIRGADLRKRA